MGLSKARSSSTHPARPSGAITEVLASDPAVNAQPAATAEVAQASAGEGSGDSRPTLTLASSAGPAPAEAQQPAAPPSEDADAPVEGGEADHSTDRSAGPHVPVPPASQAAPAHRTPAVQVSPSRALGAADILTLTPPAGMPHIDLLDATKPAEQVTLAATTQTRRVATSKRGKRDYNYSWPSVDVRRMREAHERWRGPYRTYWTEADPHGTYRLNFSSFVARALLEAFSTDLGTWLPTVRNDARREPVGGGREQVGLVWPVEVENYVVETWETLDRSQFPDGFHLTKQHLAAAAILHGLESVRGWVLSVPNDDRFNVPVPGDGRLKENRGAGRPEG